MPASGLQQLNNISIRKKPVLVKDVTDQPGVAGELDALSRAAELEALNRLLRFQVDEREKRAAELLIANKELALQTVEKEKRAAELVVANEELAFQNREKEKRADELEELNRLLLFQVDEREKRAAELLIANKELALQTVEKEKRAAELVIANEELAFQNREKEKRAYELEELNRLLLFQVDETEKRAAEVLFANKELALQTIDKEKRAAELVIANEELAFQNQEKEKRAAELITANQELQVFTYISSHDLQEPLRKIEVLASTLLHKESHCITPDGKHRLTRMQAAARQMRTLIEALQVYSHINLQQQTFAIIRVNPIVDKVLQELSALVKEKGATIHTGELGEACINEQQFSQVIWHLVDNALKFSRETVPPDIHITARIGIGATLQKANRLLHRKLSATAAYYHLSLQDNGIGFEPRHGEKIFEVFQRLHLKGVYKGTGIGLPIVKKIVDNHGGYITAAGRPGAGAIFDIYIPA